jgi:hypothetical protein
LKALAAVEHVRSKLQPGALTLEIISRNKLLWNSRTEEEVTKMANAMFTIAKLDSDDINPDDKKGFMGNKFYVGTLLFGLYKSSYSLSMNLAQLREGARLFLDGAGHKYSQAVIDSFAVGSFESLYALDASLYPLGAFPISLVELAAFQNYIVNVIGNLEARARVGKGGLSSVLSIHAMLCFYNC